MMTDVVYTHKEWDEATHFGMNNEAKFVSGATSGWGKSYEVKDGLKYFQIMLSNRLLK